MAFDAHANLAYSRVLVAPIPAASGTSLTVAAGQGALFPATPFNATVWPIGTFPLQSNAEIVRVTAIVGDVLTITRMQEGTSARTIVVGDQLANTVTAKVITDLESAIVGGGITAIGVSAGTLSSMRSDVTFGDSNGVSFGLNTDGIITGTVRTNYQASGNYLTTAALSQDSSKYAGTAGAMTGGSITVNTSGVSVNLPAYLTTAMQSNAVTLSNIRVSAGTTSNLLSALTFANASGVSFGINAGTVTATVKTDYQSSGAYLTTAALSQDSSKYAGTNGAITGGSITVNTSGVSVNLPAYLTTAMASNRASDFVQATAVFNGTNASGTVASGAISVSVATPIPIATSVNPVASASSVGTATRYAAEDHRHAGIGGVGISTSGNTAGTTGSVVGTYWFQGGNNITVSQITSNNGSHTLILSGANAGGAQTGISGIVASDATYTSGTVTFTGVGGGITVNSNTGQRIDISVAAPAPIGTSVNAVASASSVGTITRYAAEDHAHAGIGGLGISTSGNTAGTTGSVVGTYWFQGGNNITVSQITSNNGSHTLVLSGANAGGAQTGISGVVVSDTTYSSGTVSFSAQNNITIGSSVNGGTQYIRLSVGNYLTTAMASDRGTDFVQATAGFNGTNASGTIASNAISVSVAAQSNQSAIKALGVSDTGQTAGNTGVSTGIDWVLAGSQSITLSQSTAVGGPNTVWFQHPAWLTTAMQSNAVTLSNIRVSAGTTSNLLSAITFADGSGVSWGINASTITATVKTDYLTTAMASNRASDFVQATAVFNGTNATGTIASGAISVSVATPIPIGTSVNPVASASSVGTVTRYAPEDHRHAGIGAVGISTSGNTAGTTGSVVGTYWFEGGNSITVSQITSNNGSHTLRLSVGNYITTAMASNRASDFVQATAVFNGTNASGTIASGAISVSVAAPIPIGTSVNAVASASSVGTVTRYAPEDHRHAGVGGIGISTSGNTAGTTGSQVGTYWFEGGNSITVSQITSNNGSHTLRLSVGAYLTTAMASNRGTDFVQATAGFNGTNASGTIASDSISVSVAAPIPIGTSVNPVASASSVGTVTRYAPEDHRHAGIGAVGISTSGNTAGTTGSVVGTYWFEGGNSITVSQITSNNGSHTLRLSVGNYLTTAMASNASTQFVQANAAFAGTNASGTIASDGISVSVAAPAGGVIGTSVNPVASASSIGTVTRYAPEDHRHAGVGGIGISTSGNTAGTTGSQVGTYWFEGGNSITVSQITSDNGSHTLRLSVGNYLTTAALSGDTTKYVQAWELTGNTAGTTSSLQGTKIYFEGGNSITVSGNSNTIKFSVGAYLTTAMASNRGTDFVQATAGFNGTNASGTIASNAISVSVAAPIPIGTSVNPVASASSVGTVTRYAAEDHRHAGIGGLGISTSGNTAGTTGSVVGTYWFQGGNNITVSQITSNNGSHTLVLSGANAAGSLNVSAGTTSNNLTALTFADSNGVSFGLNASTITATVATYSTVGTATSVANVGSASSVGTITRWAAEDHVHAGVAAIGISTGNTAGTSGSQVGSYWIAGSNNITLSQITSNNGSHTLNIIGDRLNSQFDPFKGIAPISNSTLGQSTVYIVPFDVQAAISASRINFFLSLTHTYSGAPANSTAWLALGYALYTRGTGASTDRISTVASYSLSYVSASVSSSTRLSVTNYIGLSNATSHTTSQYGVQNASVSDYLGSSIAGFRVLALPMNVTMTPGRYWLAMSGQSASQGVSMVFSHTIFQQQLSNNIAFRPFGVVSAASDASVWGMSDGVGSYSAQTAAFPDTIPLTASAIKMGPIVTFPYFNISGIGTSNVIL